MWWDLSALTRRAPTPPSAKAAHVGDPGARRAVGLALIIARFAPNRFGISHVVGFVSLDAAGSHPAKRKSGACRGLRGLARKPASP
jgi:hypothetical protein